MFNTTIDDLIDGDVEEKAKASLYDAKLLGLFKSVERMNDEDKTAITRLINAIF